MSVAPFILATAGHVDHGKSALVRALTGTDPDRLPEEKARGITIDLGFAHLDLPAPRGSPAGVERFSCGVVDVPGHEDFVRNMVAGVGSVDLALLVVAADDGWMPQTEEHLQILTYLGVSRAVVALTKIDLAPPGTEPALLDAVRQRLADSPFPEAPILPTSIPTGRGLDELRSALARSLAETPRPADVGKPRLWIDRVFALPGAGTIVTGTLTGGPLSRGDPVVIQPGNLASRIRACHSHGREQERIEPGSRAGFNLPDLRVEDLRRGLVVTREVPDSATSTLDLLLVRSPRLAGSGQAAARPLRSGSRVRIHLGSASAHARLVLLQEDSLSPGTRGLAQARLETPMVAFTGDAVVVRDAAEQATLAGGRILDPSPTRTRLREASRLAALHDCAARPQDPEPFLRLVLARDGPQPSAALLRRSRFSCREIATALGRLAGGSEVVLAGSLAAPAAWWTRAVAWALAEIDRRHAEHPEQQGVPLAELRSRLEGELGLREGFEELIAALGREGCTPHGAFVRRSRHRPALPPHLASAGQHLREVLGRHRLDPPARAALAPDPTSRMALRFLVESGEAVELGPDLVLSAEAFQLARERLRVALRRHGTATASELRQVLGTSRRILIPLLERLDRDGVTRREGDRRRLA